MKRRRLDITGLALVEGVMIKHEGQYAMALRKGNSDIEIIHDVYKGILGRGPFSKIPILRGIFALIDYLVLGIKLFLFSSDYHEDNGDEEPQAFQKMCQKIAGRYHESLEMVLFITLTLTLSVLGFVVLPYYVSGLIADRILFGTQKMMIIEIALRVFMIVLYICMLSLNRDVRRIYAYHGAQHKVINCLKRGDELTIKNVRRSSRYDKNCEFNFILSVIIVSLVLFSVVRTNDMWVRMGIRILIIPVVAAILYEVMLLFKNIDNPLVDVLQFPQRILQNIIAKEPTEDMMEVAIESVTAAYDWRDYLGLEPLEEEEDYTQYDYEDNVSRRGNYTVEASGSQMLYDENFTQDYQAVNNADFGYTNVNQDYYNHESYNYNVPSYDRSHYDYSQQYFVESDGKESSAYTEVLENEITKQPGKEYTNNYSNVSYEELYNSFTEGQNMSGQYNNNMYEGNNYSNQYTQYDMNQYNGADYSQQYGYRGGRMDHKNYVEDNDDLDSLDRYFGDDNY